MKYIADSDLTLMQTLSLLFPNSSKTTLREWLKEERVTVDGIAIKQSHFPVRKGQLIALGARKRFMKADIQIIYEDRDLVVIDKPADLLSVATNFTSEMTAHAFLKEKYYPRKVYVVHRLDQATSGLILFALSERAYKELKKIFEKHDIERHYYAIVEGHVAQKTGSWQSFLYEDKQYRVHSCQQADRGELAITHYEVKKESKRFSQLKLRLETGKKNQIRVHCQEAGHPVVGDKKYGAKSNPMKRLCLHATHLAFDHPITGKRMAFDSPLPKEFSKLIK